MELRPYQEEAVCATFDYFKAGNKGNPVIELPTGSGKSVVIAEIAKRAYQGWSGTRIIIATDSQTLVEQNAEKLLQIWPDAPVGIYSAGLGRRDIHKPITFAGIDSIAKKPHIFGKVSLFLNDECHMFDYKPKTRYRKFVDGLRMVNPRVKGIGLSATPWRMGVGHITYGGFYTHTAYSKIGVDDFHYFVENGWLAPLYPIRTKMQIDVSDVETLGGDFNLGQLSAATNKAEITRAAILESIELAGHCGHWMVFCTDVQHVENTVEMLNAMGISAVGVHSKQDAKVNKRNIELAKSGAVRALVNMGVLTKGFDWPECDYIMMLRATKSAPLWVQMLGRGTRPAPWAGKTCCLVGDFAGNADRLGPINDPVIPRPKGAGKGGTAPIRVCSTWEETSDAGIVVKVWNGCGNQNHASAKKCDRCGNPFPPPKSKLKQRAGDTAMMRDSGDGDDGNPQVDTFKVDNVSYRSNSKPGKPTNLAITYFCGLRMFTEYKCFEHEPGTFPHKVALEWWKKLYPGTETYPEFVLDVLEMSDVLPTPTHIRVWHNKQFPEIMNHCFDGTAFGTQEPYADDDSPIPDLEDIPGFEAPKQIQTIDDYELDDIPF